MNIELSVTMLIASDSQIALGQDLAFCDNRQVLCILIVFNYLIKVVRLKVTNG